MSLNDASEEDGKIRLTIVQMGDYAEAFERFEAGEEETYYAQKYSVDYMGALLGRGVADQINVITALRDAPLLTLSNGVKTAGVELFRQGGRPRYRELIALLDQIDSTHIICAMPLSPLLRWAIGQKAQLLPLFADSFCSSGLRDRLRYFRLSRLLNNKAVPFVANHNIVASLDLRRIGVRQDKIIPFDWPALMSPRDHQAKKGPASDPLQLVYVGQITEAKGVGDAIEALSHLEQLGISARLTLIGRGDSERFQALGEARGVADQVQFAGMMPHSTVLKKMRAADVVLVPSHHDYPEGLPMTLYEAMSMRTPLVTSDHPMFSLKIFHDENALVFPAGDADAMAQAIARLVTEPGLYGRISQNTELAAEGYLCPLEWKDLISGFLDPAQWDKLRAYSLARHNYGS